MAQVLVAGGLLAASLAEPALAAGPDHPADAIALTPGTTVSDTNGGTNVETPELLTPTDGRGCLASGLLGSAGQGELMGGTVWYKFAGNNRWLTIDTRGTTAFDTVLGVYEDNFFRSCNNDYRPTKALESEVRIRSIAGHSYLFQLGSHCLEDPCSTVPAGTYFITLRVAPNNDDRASALPLSEGNVTVYNNLGATEETSEKLSCDARSPVAPFAKTVWFKYHAPSTGTATFTTSTTSGTDTVLAVYRGGDANYAGCNDDPSTTAGASRVQLDVTEGDYYIQVGGFNPNTTLTVPTAAMQGSFVPNVAFAPVGDRDGDKYDAPPAGTDCDDTNAAIHPGAAEVPNNAVDENCDGVAAQDRDGDAYLAPPAGNDCDDANARRHPGAVEVPADGIDEDCDGREDNDADNDGFDRKPIGKDCNDANHSIHPGAGEVAGNWIDENCDGVKKAGALDPDPQFSMPNFALATYTRIASPLTVSDVRRGYRVTIRCNGRGCPFRSQTKVAKSRKTLRFTRLVNSFLRPGTVVTAWVRWPGHNLRGRYARWPVRAGKQMVRTTACLQPPKFKKVIRCG